ncbi:MAG: indolepyruvate oxidoreductase subunit beta [Deltaproteobacteria bacterium]|nr:indolepyruvate oxidoreductase subunit beta [Deltaproteobacteria bacterium]
MSSKVTNILVAGVGGQGVILASDIMADTFLEAGYDVKKSEVHGMAQRGGSVSSHVRFGQKVYSPIIKMGEVDYLCMMEKMETLRWLNYCNKSTVILMDDVEVNPPVVNLGEMEYPRDIEEILKNNFKNFHIIPAATIAAGLGPDRAANVVLTGALSKLLAIDQEIWLKSLLARLPEKLHTLNKKAFLTGRKALSDF